VKRTGQATRFGVRVREEYMSEYIISVDFEIREGMLDQVLPLVIQNATNSVQQEPGCLQFDVVQDNANPHHLMLFEVYRDEAAFQAHGKMPYVADFLAKARPMFAKTTMTKLTRKAHPVKG
jgi:quinol monooxygenase YgiN